LLASICLLNYAGKTVERKGTAYFVSGGYVYDLRQGGAWFEYPARTEGFCGFPESLHATRRKVPYIRS
jgi:hypothetical protein